jgi:hypothetical protein
MFLRVGILKFSHVSSGTQGVLDASASMGRSQIVAAVAHVLAIKSSRSANPDGHPIYLSDPELSGGLAV